METPEAPSDAELIARVRNGDLEAYGELFGRHHHAAERMARQLVPANDADDLASDAFAKVLDALRGGGGPDISFRAYLLTTVRRVHVDRIRSGRKVQTTDDIAAYEREPESFDDPSVTGFESGAAAKAFASLPERWQAVLWHTEVEGEKPAAIAPLLGLTANGVSALAYRAREGLRQAYLQQHLADVAGDRCRWTTERLGAYVRGGLTKRENRNVREHMDDCAKCTAVYLELVEVNSALPALLAPALLGTAGLGYLAAASGAKIGFVGFLVTGWKKATENSTRTAVSAGAVVVVAVAAVLAAMALTGNETPPAAISNPPAQQTQPPVEPPTVKPPPVKPPTVKPPVVPPTKAEPSEPEPQPTEEPTTAPTSAPTTAPTRPTPTPTPTPTPPKPTPTTPILDEGLLTISAPRSSGGTPARGPDNAPRGVPAGAQGGAYGSSSVPSGIDSGRSTPQAAAAPRDEDDAAAAQEWLITIKAPANNVKPVVVGIKYGAALRWPLSSNPSGWTCARAADGRSGSCTANNPRSPQPFPVKFASPQSGSEADRTFTVSAKTGRLYDDDSRTMAAPPSMDENLLKITVRKADPDAHPRTLTVAPGTDRDKVTLKIQYGEALSWPIAPKPAGWTCTKSTRTCVAANPSKPAPLPADFEVPEGGSKESRTYSVTAQAGLVSDTDDETLSPRRLDESLLKIVKPGYPSPGVHRRDLTIYGTEGPVELEIRWGKKVFLLDAATKGWTCELSPDIRSARCRTERYSEALETVWGRCPGPGHIPLPIPHQGLCWGSGSGGKATVEVTATTPGRFDTDESTIPANGPHR